MLGYISTILLIPLYLLTYKNKSFFILRAYILIQSIINILPFGLLKYLISKTESLIYLLKNINQNLYFIS